MPTKKTVWVVGFLFGRIENVNAIFDSKEEAWNYSQNRGLWVYEVELNKELHKAVI